ncbi:hypothetical protein D3C87_1707660 [compost metagenome]
MFLLLAPAQDQRRQHHAGGDRRFRVLLRDQQPILADELLAGVRVVAAEDGGYEVKHPLVAALTERRLARQIDNAQFLEDGKRLLGLLREYWRRDDRQTIS